MSDVTDSYSQSEDKLKISKHVFSSRLILGTGKYKDFLETKRAIQAAQCDMFTVAVRRVNILDKSSDFLQNYLSPQDYVYLPNTAGCFTCDEAVRTLKLAREQGGWNLVKLEVLGDDKTLYPNVIETVKAAAQLVEDGFEVMVYTSDDPLVAKELEDIGCVAIMPLVAPIGSGLGIQNRLNLEFILDSISVPVIVDAGVGVVSDASIVMEMGCDGVLLNTAVASAKNPILMAEAMRLAVIAGRKCYLAGRMEKKKYGVASSSNKGLLD